MPQEVAGYREVEPVVTGETDTRTGEEIDREREPVYEKRHGDGTKTRVYVLNPADTDKDRAKVYKAYAVTFGLRAGQNADKQMVGAELKNRFSEVSARNPLSQYNFIEIDRFSEKYPAEKAMLDWMRQNPEGVGAINSWVQGAFGGMFGPPRSPETTGSNLFGDGQEEDRQRDDDPYNPFMG